MPLYRPKTRPAAVLLSFVAFAAPALAGMTITDLGKTYAPDPDKTPPTLRQDVEAGDVIGGNTSVRNEPADALDWKGGDAANAGYFQRNRDLGQIFNVVGDAPLVLDALVIRTGRGDNAVMSGAPGAAMYVQFFEVTCPPAGLAIDEVGTGRGEPATHGFDLSLNRADDFITGARYRPLHRTVSAPFPSVEPTTQYVYDRGDERPFGEQPGHLRFVRFAFADADRLTLLPGRRYAFLVGFESPGADRGLGLAITTTVHTPEQAVFVTDAAGLIRWGVRREGSGLLPPTTLPSARPPTDPAVHDRLVAESLFAPDHWNALEPTSNGYPDVDTYRTLQFYLEARPAPTTRPAEEAGD